MSRITTVMASVLLLLSFLTLTSAKRSSKDKDAVLLENIKTLTFQDGKETTHRRVSAMPQLTCTSGSGCAYHKPPSIRCTNSGSSYSTADVEWTCTAPLPPEFKLGSTDVVCEGYDNADDPYILKGSCALEYRLLLTDLGAEKFGSKARAGSSWLGGSRGRAEGEGEGSKLPGALFLVIFVAIACWIGWSFIRNLLNADGPPRRGLPPGGYGRGGDDDGNDDPPPPYQPYPGRSPKSTKGAQSLFGSPRQTQPRAPRQPRSQQAQAQSESWRPGLWTGAAAGAAAGWLAGNRGAATRPQQPRQMQQTWDNGEGSSRGARSWGGFGGGGGSGGRGPSMSSERYESTGFGGTRRR